MCKIHYLHSHVNHVPENLLDQSEMSGKLYRNDGKQEAEMQEMAGL